MIRDTSSTVLLSLRPKYAELIISGQKRAEIRRLPSRIQAGTTALVYASTPCRSLVGAVQVLDVQRLAPSTTWKRWGRDTGLAKAEFDDYVQGQRQVTTLVLGAVVRFSNPLSLDTLRDRWKPFIAPQSYRFLRDAEFSAILNGERNELDKLIPRRIHRDGGRQSNEPAGGAPGTSGSC